MTSAKTGKFPPSLKAGFTFYIVLIYLVVLVLTKVTGNKEKEEK